jgi:AAA15 family ATPase/GTPase
MHSAYISTNDVIYLNQTEIQMLIEFSVTNFRSIFERQTLSLAMASGGEHRATNVFQYDGANKFDLLRSAAIYGPNASGKSNLLVALRTMQDCVRESATKLTSGDKLPAEVLKLNPEARKLPSAFEVTIIAKGVRYQYGFSISQERVEEEWLLAYPKGRPQQWFTREWDKVGCKYRWEIGSALIGEKQLWQKSTRDNSLFLSTAVQLNCEQLKPVFDWFNDILHTVKVGGWGSSYSAISKKHIPKYEKSCNGLFQELLPLLEKAKSNAKQALAQAKAVGTDNPSIKIHVLVDDLQSLHDQRKRR